MLHSTAHLRVAEDLLLDLLCDSARDRPGVKVPGFTPFFSGLQMHKDVGMCQYFAAALDTKEDDKEEMKKRKKDLRACV